MQKDEKIAFAIVGVICTVVFLMIMFGEFPERKPYDPNAGYYDSYNGWIKLNPDYKHLTIDEWRGLYRSELLPGQKPKKKDKGVGIGIGISPTTGEVVPTITP